MYPDYFPGYLEKGLFGKALKEKIWSLEIVDIRNYAEDKHKTVDDTPYGGGDGMIMKADVLARSLDKNLPQDEKIIYLSPKGKIFDHNCAKRFSEFESINFICGHFEGIDQRIIDSRNIEEISIGDFVLSGGETAVFVVLDAILRFVPGVLGNVNSSKNESFKMVFWNILNILNLKFSSKKVGQKCYYQEIMPKLKTGVYHNLRL